MVSAYNVARFDQVSFGQLKEVGFTSELVQFLAAYGITKDEVVEFCERAADPNLKLDAIIGGVIEQKEEAARNAREASLPSAETAAE